MFAVIKRQTDEVEGVLCGVPQVVVLRPTEEAADKWVDAEIEQLLEDAGNPKSFNRRRNRNTQWLEDDEGTWVTYTVQDITKHLLKTNPV
jgi:hypothetical protein